MLLRALQSTDVSDGNGAFVSRIKRSSSSLEQEKQQLAAGSDKAPLMDATSPLATRRIKTEAVTQPPTPQPNQQPITQLTPQPCQATAQSIAQAIAQPTIAPQQPFAQPNASSLHLNLPSTSADGFISSVRAE